jgi:hypothetical protein
MSFLSAIPGWAWLLLVLVPPAIIALYFLKLKRAPIVVPSTYLWLRTIEDLHVNSLWQRLQKNVLLYLQLLLVFLLLLSLLRPGCRSESTLGQRSILLIDHSASMSATDESPNRLAKAKEKAINLIDSMSSSDVAMVIAFSDRAEIKQGFTSDRRQLRSAIEAIEPTNRITDIREAMRAAAGLANPGRTSEIDNVNDIQVAEALPADLFIFSDGGFAEVSEFDLGNLSATYVPIGSKDVDNVGIVALTANRNPERENEIEIYARLINHAAGNRTITTELLLDDNIVDATKTTLKPNEEEGISFQLKDIDSGKLLLRIKETDDFILDNQAFTTITPPTPIEVLLISERNKALEMGLQTPLATKLARTKIATPDFLESSDFAAEIAVSKYDLIIFDRVSPKTMPLSNTLFIGTAPPLEGWAFGEKHSPILIVDVQKDHPLMQYLEMKALRIFEGYTLKSPEGATRLIEADCGSIMAIASRGAYLDVVCSFGLMRLEGDKLFNNTDWPARRSFPIFLLNALETLGNTATDSAARTVLPGQPIALRVGQSINEVQVIDPDGESSNVARGSLSQLVCTQTDRLGFHEVQSLDGAAMLDQFSVNLFSMRESDIGIESDLVFGAESISGAPTKSPSRIEFWRWLTAMAIGLLTVEWLVYLRRIFL